MDRCEQEKASAGGDDQSVGPVSGQRRPKGGIVVDVLEQNTTSSFPLRLAPDGRTILIPQPTDDEQDPLNWSWRKKRAVLLAAAWAAFTCDYLATYGPALIFPQSAEWGISVFDANQPNSLCVLMASLGGLVWVPMSNCLGRAPVLLWTAVIGGAFSIGAAASQSYAAYFANRALSLFFLTSGQTMTIAILKDIFFFHERARKIGLWAMLYVASPFVGPQWSNFILHATGRWRDAAWVSVAVVGINVLLVLLIIDETWLVPLLFHVCHSLTCLPWSGIWQMQHHRTYFPATWPTIVDFFRLILEPAFFLIALNYFMSYMWAIGINISASILFAQPEEQGGYGYDAKQLGYLYFTPLVALFAAEAFGHYFNDFVAKRYIRRHQGVFEPEARVWSIYLAIFFMVPGLVLVGQALQRHLHVAAIVFGWGMHTFGLMCMSVANIAYGFDAFPASPAEVGGWLNFARTIGGFGVSYFQTPWAALVGFDGSFGAQGAISAASIVPVLIVHIWGRRLRTGKSAGVKRDR